MCTRISSLETNFHADGKYLDNLTQPSERPEIFTAVKIELLSRVASEALASNHHTTRRNNPENYEFQPYLTLPVSNIVLQQGFHNFNDH